VNAVVRGSEYEFLQSSELRYRPVQLEAALSSTTYYAGHMTNAWGEFLVACDYFGGYLVAGSVGSQANGVGGASCFQNISTLRSSLYHFLYTSPFNTAYREYSKMIDHDVDYQRQQITAIRAVRLQYAIANMNDQKTRYQDLKERDGITGGGAGETFTSQLFDVVSQSYPSVVPDTALNCGVGAAAVVVSLFFFLPPSVVAIVVCCIFLIDLLLLGWIHLLGLNLNLASSVCMTMAIGFAIDYASDIAYAFHRASGTGHQRAVQACFSMAKPVFVGGVCSLLAAGPVLFSDTLSGRIFASMVVGTVSIGIAVGFFALPAALATFAGHGMRQQSSKTLAGSAASTVQQA